MIATPHTMSGRTYQTQRGQTSLYALTQQAYTILPHSCRRIVTLLSSDEKLLNSQFEGLDLAFELAALIRCHRR